jgi:hypothetical protein
MATDIDRLSVGPRLKTMDARNICRPVKLTLRMDKLDKTPKELPGGLKTSTQVFNTEHWKVLHRLPELLG